MLLVCGGLVNGPYSLITTAVSADLVSWFTSDSSPWIHPGLLTQSEHFSLFWPLTSGNPQEPERKRQSVVHSRRHHWWDGICRSVSQITGVQSQIKSECNHLQIFNQPVFYFKMFKVKICNDQTNELYCFSLNVHLVQSMMNHSIFFLIRVVDTKQDKDPSNHYFNIMWPSVMKRNQQIRIR